MVTVSVLVKALNEERRIEACLRAAVDEALPLGGEVILVDSLSTDRTVELARAFPVRIVQFESGADCGCASAVQLGYQFSEAEFVYVLDADMVLQPGFLARAMHCMQLEPDLAGVGGRIVDVRLRTMYDKRRALSAQAQVEDRLVSELGGGGLYRVTAVEQTGYLGHRGLAAFEEAELGARLTSGGWKLRRLVLVAATHEGHDETNWQMLVRLWRNRRAHATGAVLRSAAGKPWFWTLARKQAFLAFPLLLWIFVVGMAVFMGGTARAWLGSLALTFSLAFAVLWLRQGQAVRAAWSLAVYHYYLIAGFVGALQSVRNPHDRIAGKELLLASDVVERVGMAAENDVGNSGTGSVLPVSREEILPVPAARRLRILIVTNMWPSEADPTAGIFIARQVEALRRHCSMLTIEVCHLDTVRRTHLYLTGGGAVRRAIQRFNPDIVHIHFGLTQFMCWSIVSKPTLVTLHGSDLTVSWKRAITRIFLSRGRRPIVVADSLRAYLPGRSDVVTVSCGVNAGQFSIDHDEARRKLGISPQVLLVLFGANPARKVKRYDRFEAVADILRQTAEGMSVARLSDVPVEQVPLLIAAADILLLTSDREGSPVVTKEALCSSTRVVCTPVGDLAEQLVGFSGCRVSGWEPELLARDVAECLREPRPDRQTAVDRFDHVRECGQLISAYESLVTA